MGILDTMTDPFGSRYKKKSMNERLGVTQAKRNFTRTFIQPFSKLNPMYHLRNAKRNLKRKLGYNSEFAKAYRTGNWGKYVKRKITESGMIMPFRESQFTPYDMQSNPFDKQQTGPTNKGMFRKLATYAAPGAVVGLALLSRKYKLLDKLRGAKAAAPEVKTAMQKIKHGGEKLMHKLHGGAKKAYRAIKKHAINAKDAAIFNTKLMGATALDAAKTHGGKVWKATKSRMWGIASKRPSVNPKGKPRKRNGKLPSELIHADRSKLIMPFREGRYDEEPRYARPKATFADKVLTAGAIGATALVGLKIARVLKNTKSLGKHAMMAQLKAGQLTRQAHKTPAIFQPVLQTRAAYAQMKSDVYRNAAGLSGFLMGAKATKAGSLAAKKVKFKDVLKRYGRKMEGLSSNKEARKELWRHIKKGTPSRKRRAAVSGIFHASNHKPIPDSPPLKPAATINIPDPTILRTKPSSRSRVTRTGWVMPFRIPNAKRHGKGMRIPFGRRKAK